jgi:hypothetical protein
MDETYLFLHNDKGFPLGVFIRNMLIIKNLSLQSAFIAVTAVANYNEKKVVI